MEYWAGEREREENYDRYLSSLPVAKRDVSANTGGNKREKERGTVVVTPERKDLSASVSLARRNNLESLHSLSLRELQQQQASQQQQQQSAAAAVAETARLAADRERHLQEEQRRQIQDALNR